MFTERIVKFDTPDMAKRVKFHLHHVEVEDDRLVFSEFDQQAFELAIGLEGLDETVYDFVDKEKVFHYRNPRPSFFVVTTIELIVDRSSILSAVKIEIESRFRYNYYLPSNLSDPLCFELLIKNSTDKILGFKEFSLILNEQLLRFIFLVQHEALRSTVFGVISRVDHVSLHLEEDGTSFTLAITGEDRTNKIIFSPEMLIDIAPPTIPER